MPALQTADRLLEFAHLPGAPSLRRSCFFVAKVGTSALNHQRRVPHPHRVFVFAARVGFVAASLLTGCKPVGPNYSRPGFQAPAAYKEPALRRSVLRSPPNPAGGGWRPASPSDGMIRGKWWEIYQDPQLDQLEDRISPKGQPNNQTLRQALETYLAARDQIAVARASLFPTLSAGVSASAREFRPTDPTIPPPNPQLQRFFAERPGQLGAGFLGPHPPHRRGRPLERPGQRRRPGEH